MRKVVFAHFGLLFITFIWGTTFVVVQKAISLIEPFTFNAVRFLFAGLILLLAHTFSPNKEKNVKLGPGIGIGVFLFGGYLFQTFGLLYTTSSKAGFLTGLSVVMVPLFSYIFFRHKTSLFAIFGVGIATIGLFFLTADGSFALQKGDILVLFCAVSFALHIIINGIFSKEYSPLFLSTIQILTVGILSSICAIFFEDYHRIFSVAVWSNPSFVFAILITAVMGTALAFLIQTVAQTYTSPTRVAIILSMEPVFAALTGVIIANEILSTSALIGCSCILFGMIFAELPTKRKKPQAAA
ncbi:DMT family transporter [Ectobacillus sp. sgz5001026]|uniref:DMT family transporter n=1 Tax=Ectobacillus sp. sgz5001026 TaxID=3242473 RepID=UPI0036D43D4E